MGAISRALPALAWRRVRLVGGVEEGLLQDEMQEVETAALVILEAGMPHVSDTSADTSEDTSLDTSIGTSTDTSMDTSTGAHRATGLAATAGAAMGLEDPLCRYRVAAVPGLRVRAAPSLSAPRVGVLRTGQIVSGGRAAAGDWVPLEGG
eukprot:scaffold8568_cov101-Isochrysis_galbana.AAC.1